MRTIHIVATHGLGGAERFFLRLTSALAHAGHPTRAVLRKGNPLAAHVDPEVERMELGLRPHVDLRTVRDIRAMASDWEPRVVQTYMERATRLTRMPKRSPTVHVARLGGHYTPWSFRHADLWVGNARNVCDYLVRKGFSADRVHLIGNFVDIPEPPSPTERDRTRGRFGVPEDDWLVVALGRFAAKKGFADLVHAVSLMPEEVGGRRVRVVIAGEGAGRAAMEAAIEGADLGERVLLPGWVDDPTGLLAASDLLVCPSRFEALGNTILEGWSHALPVVSTRTPGPSELVEDGETGILTRIHDPADLARGIIEALEASERERRGMGERGLDRVRADFTVDVIRDRYLDLYERATKRR